MSGNHNHSHAAEQMAQACNNFLDSLSSQQKARANLQYLTLERMYWYYPPGNRNGLPLRDMDEGQRELAYAMVESSLTEESYKKACLIIDHEAVLGPLEKEEGRITFDRNPLLYYFTVFGDLTNSKDPWGWRVEGHHVSLHFSVLGDKVISSTPFFYGANPAEVRKGPKQGLRILDARQDLAFEFMNNLDKGQRSKAVIHDDAPWDILTYNSSKVVIPWEEGIAGRNLNGTQREILMALITEYVSQVREDVAEQKMDSIREQGLDGFHFAWAGPVGDMRKPHYYRIHSGNFVVEYDNRQNGANHIHSVLRDVENDFAQDVMREHLLMYHVL